MNILMLCAEARIQADQYVADMNPASVEAFDRKQCTVLLHDGSTVKFHTVTGQINCVDCFRGMWFDMVVETVELDGKVRRSPDKTRDRMRSNIAYIKMAVTF